MTETTDHLEPVNTDRGFRMLPQIFCRDGRIKVYESSAATAPHIWVNVANLADENATLHLPLEKAQQLAEQLQWLVANHYQVSP